MTGTAGDRAPHRRDPGQCPHRRRERDRQGTPGALRPRAQPAAGRALRRHQLRGPARGAPGQRAVRPREGGLHRGPVGAQGPDRGRRGRHPVPGRDRRDLPGDAGQAAAGDRGARAVPGGRQQAGPGGPALPRRHQPQSGRGGGGGTLPARPLLPAQRGRAASSRRSPTGAGTYRCSPATSSSGRRPCSAGPSARISPEAMDLLMGYDYPGNIRELANLIERGVALAEGDTVEVRHIPDHLRARQAQRPAPERRPAPDPGGAGAPIRPARPGEDRGQPHPGGADPRHRPRLPVAQAQALWAGRLRPRRQGIDHLRGAGGWGHLSFRRS